MARFTSRFLTASIAALPATVPFVGPEALVRRNGGQPFAARLGANESGFGPSPKAIAAMAEAAAANWMYADPENYDLRAALARMHGIGIEHVVIGEGCDGLLGLACKLVLEPGTAVVTSDGAYPTFNFHVVQHGGRLIKVPYRNDREDIEALLATARAERAKVVYLSNPDNPMGSWWAASDIAALIERLPADTLLFLDEAYSDTAPANAVPALDVSHPNVLRFRTFSKAYGLAGARIGYALGEAGLIGAFEKVRNHYGINRVGQVGALAALDDRAYLADAVARIARARETISEIARRHGLEPLPSATNFVAIDCGRGEDFARSILQGVVARGVFVRMPAVAPLSRCIRVSTGREADLVLFAEALAAAVEEARRAG
ncbi:MAG: pyridoxal phosphate-dependent aminotransferase [Hyphomicrobiaceae bacterium]|nr:pyridoxal phosphate-dependent aminotransferase [Hyphomicrobiaceae bacterium]